ncbi:MAG: hypothetical protein ACO3JL_12035, partial [Myxococcota bacterium]
GSAAGIASAALDRAHAGGSLVNAMWVSDETRRRGRAAALAVLYAFGAFASLAHVAAVEHVRCPEHGELVHAEAAHFGGDTQVTVATFSSQQRLRVGAVGEEHADHGHCGVLVRHASDGVSLAVATETVPPRAPALLASPTAADEVRHAAEARYRLAPKQGPPRA